MSEQRAEVFVFLEVVQDDDFSVFGCGTVGQQPDLRAGAAVAASSAGVVQL